MFKKLFVSLAIVSCAGVLAQPQLSPTRPTMGVVLMEPDNVPGVVLVADVGARTPGAAAGLLVGDYVVRIGERAVTRIADVIAELDQAEPGASVRIVVRRRDQEQTFQVTPSRE